MQNLCRVSLEVSTLKRTPIPDPKAIEPSLFRVIVDLVSKRLEITGSEAREIELMLDEHVANAYGLSSSEKRLVGMGSLE